MSLTSPRYRWPNFAIIGLSLSLLASCGQVTPKGAVSSPSGSQAAQTGAGTRSIPATPPEPVQATQPTELPTEVPGGLRAQAVDKSIPIILVHGALGFGRDEFGGAVKYWGGVHDVQEDLRAQGYQVYTASVGPLSSVWDRAAELYAQIKGGCVDYGADHSAKSGHTRSDPAKCYAGFYPEWDADHPVNLIGHSLGVATSRMLIKLLEDGSAANAEGHNLYTGGRVGWVKCMMGISGPVTGTPALEFIDSVIPALKGLLFAFAVSGEQTGGDAIYNFDLGQFGITRRPGESLSDYTDRVMASPFMNSKDSTIWDGSTDGAKVLNAYVGRSSRVKYFTWSNSDTSRGLLTGWAYPNPTMAPALAVFAYPYPRPLVPGMGNVYGKSRYGTVTYDSSWWPNDGLVASNYMDAPPEQVTLRYTGQATQPGQWYALGRLNGWDHTDTVGLLTLRDVRPFYRAQAAFLNSQ